MREIDLQTWARRNVYGLFSDCDWPFYQVSFPLDVTNLRAYTKKEGLSFYLTLSWLLTKGMEQQEAFLIRIREGRLFVLDELMPSCTVLRPGEEVFALSRFRRARILPISAAAPERLRKRRRRCMTKKPRGATI